LSDTEEDDKNRAIPPIIDDDDDDDEIDDVTDVWDEEKLKAALGELHKSREASGPATSAARGGRASVEVDRAPARDTTGTKSDTDPPPAPASGGLSWPLTIMLAVVLAAAVYLLVTFLK
jgi:hypothetical protein